MKRLAIPVALLALLPSCHNSSSSDVITATMFKLLSGMTFKQALESQFRSQLATRSYPAGMLTRWSSSTLGVPDKAPNLRTDIERIGLASAYLDANALTSFQQNFPEGHGSLAYRWSSMPAGTLSPGRYNFAFMDLRDKVAFTEDTRRFQYAFVFDRDGDTSNNYHGQAPYDLDFYNDSDLWFQLVKNFAGAWVFSALSARNNNITPFDTEALLLACDDVLMLMFPQDDIDELLYCPKCRCTAFESANDYGQNPPHDWYASLRPERGEHLFGQQWSVLRKVDPLIKIQARFLEVDSGYFTNLGIPLDLLASYGAAPGFDFGVKTREQHDQLLSANLIGGFDNDYSFVPTGLDRGGLGVDLSLSASLDYRSWVTQPGPRSFAIDDKDETAFTGNLTVDYKTPWYVGVQASVGDLYGKIGDTALLDQVLNGPSAHVLAAPTLTLFNGQRGLIQIADSTQAIANIESPLKEEIEARVPNAISLETGYTIDLQPYLNNNGSIGIQFRLDTRGVAVRSGEELTIGTTMGYLDMPFFRHGETLTSRIDLESGQTLVLGGMQNLNDPSKREGVPLMKDLPVLGQLFNRRYTDDTKELVIVITPQIIRQF